MCCGFGGTFAVKYPEISNAIVDEEDRARSPATGADTLLAGDLGCLMNMAGKLSRHGSDVEVRHVAEVLAGHDRRAADRGRQVSPLRPPRRAERPRRAIRARP